MEGAVATSSTGMSVPAELEVSGYNVRAVHLHEYNSVLLSHTAVNEPIIVKHV